MDIVILRLCINTCAKPSSFFIRCRFHDLYAAYQRATFDHVRDERSWQTSFKQLLLLPGPGPDQRKLNLYDNLELICQVNRCLDH